MNSIYIGKIVSTHGIKGEIKILSNFEYKEQAFKVNTHIIVNDVSYKILSYRKHKNFDMLTLEGFDNINDVLFLMGKQVYKQKEELNLNSDEILDEDLLNFKVLDQNNNEGKIKEIFYASKTNKILRINFAKEVLIPYNSPFIKKIDKNKKTIEIELLEGWNK